MKKVISVLLASLMLISGASCSLKPGERSQEEKIVLRVDCWPGASSNPEVYEKKMKAKEAFEKKYPDIVIEPVAYRFASDTFLSKAAANQLADLVGDVPFTEVDKIIAAGYAADLTPFMEKYGYTENLVDDIKEMVTRDSKIYMIPSSAYVLGIMANKNVFEQAGELDENGLIDYPDTFDELGQLAGRIKAKTGKAGFIMPTTKNCGGWHFMNIAWAYGTEFVAKEGDRWVAKFASPECEAALQFIKDLKWKYDALSDNLFIDNAEGYRMLSKEQGAMYFSDSSHDTITHNVKKQGMAADSVSTGKIPSGPAGRYALMGGGMYIISADADEAVIDAAFKWLEFTGAGARLTNENLKDYENEMENMKKQGIPIVGKTLFSIWKQGDIIEKKNEVLANYGTLDIDLFREYIDISDVTIKPEEPVCCQELYALLDICIQEVIQNKDADIHQLLADAANKFQINYLDNLK